MALTYLVIVAPAVNRRAGILLITDNFQNHSLRPKVHLANTIPSGVHSFRGFILHRGRGLLLIHNPCSLRYGHPASYVDSIGYQQVPEFLREQQELTPDARMTGEQIRTPRGSFRVTDMTREQMEAAGYGFHHQSEDGQYFIMGNGTQAFAVAAAQPESPLKHIEDTVEQNDNSFDGIINNTPPTPTVDELEAKVQAGEQISLLDLADAIKADSERGGKDKPEKKPSKELQAELYQREDLRRCTVCGAAFASSSNSVKYCPDCRKRITRKQTAERMRKRRAHVTR